MKKYNNVVLDVNKRNLILSKMIKTFNYNINKFEDLKIVVKDTTVTIKFNQKITTTFKSKQYNEWEDICQFKLIDNTFHMKYIDNNVIKEWSCDLVDLPNYVFYGFMKLYHVVNIIKWCYQCLITKYTWIYDNIHISDEFNHNVLMSITGNYHVRIDDELLANSGLKFSKFIATADEVVVLKSSDDFEQTSYEFVNGCRTSFNGYIDQHHNNIADCSNVYDYIKSYSKFSKEFIKLIGEEIIIKARYKNKTMTDLYFIHRFYQANNCSKDAVKLLELKTHDCNNLLSDINKMLNSMLETSNYISPRINKWLKYKDVDESYKLSYKDLSTIKENHDSLITYYNSYNSALRVFKKEITENKIIQQFKEKYDKTKSVIPTFVEFVKSKNHTIYLLNNSNLFIEEGLKQKHCVASYISNILNNKSHNYGIVHFEGYTAELLLDNLGTSRNIIQFKGVNNQDNNEKESEFRELLIEFNNNKQ